MAIDTIATMSKGDAQSNRASAVITPNAAMADKLILPPIDLVGRSKRSNLGTQDYLNMLEDFYGKRSYNVGRFQKISGLNVTGDLNQETKRAIEKAYAEALSNPEKAVSEGKIVVSSTSAKEFKSVIRGKLAKALGVDYNKLADNEVFEVAKQFQRANGLVPDAIIGTKTLSKLDSVIQSRNADTQGAYSDRKDEGRPASGKENNIPVGMQAITYANDLLDIQKRREFILQTDMSNKSSDAIVNGVPHSSMVIVLQGLMKTIGYNGSMTPGAFDNNMGSFISNFQSSAIREGLLPPFEIVQGQHLRIDPYGPDPGCMPGDVGKDTLRLLRTRALNILKSKA